MGIKSLISRIISLARRFWLFPLSIAFLALLGIAFLNKFPKAYLYSYSDFFQLSNFHDTLKWFSNAFVDSREGSVNFLYVPFYYSLLGFIQNLVGRQSMSVFYCLFFLLGSFCSFYIAALFFGLNRKKDNITIVIFSFLYAVNTYSVLRFELPSIYFIPYIFIPLLFASIHAYFLEPRVLHRHLLWCAIFMLISTVCWAGPPFFVAYSIFIFVYIILLFILFKKYSLFTFLKKCILYCFIFLSSFAMYLFTWPAILLGYSSGIRQGSYDVNMHDWVYSQSLTMLDVFTFRNRLVGLVNLNHSYFVLFNAVSLFIFILFIGGFLFIKNNRFKKTYIIFGLMILVAIFFLNKGSGLPWETAVHHIFITNIILSSLRSFDKILIFLPFLLLMPICLYSSDKKYKLVPILLLFLTLIVSWPFIHGDLYKKHYGPENGKNYLSGMHSSLVKIPQQYFDLAGSINRQKQDFRIISIPWSLENADLKGWLISPKWKVKSVNPFTQYLDHPLVQMNDPTSFRVWNYGKEWNDQAESESIWLMPFLGLLNVKYLIFQKDVPEIFVKKAAPKMDYYRKKSFIKLLFSNDYFDFYEISDIFYLPHLYIPDRSNYINDLGGLPLALVSGFSGNKTVVLESDLQSIPAQLFTNNRVVIEYKKINPAKYKVKFHNINKSFPFVFSESFHSSWKVYPVRYAEQRGGNIEKYSIFEQNSAEQASKDDLRAYIDKGWVSELGGCALKAKKRFTWLSFNLEKCYYDKYNFDFISKNIRNTIQNDNLSNGNFYDTLFLKPIDDRFHQIANGYANFWLIDTGYLKDNFPEALNKNIDGSFDLETVIEFAPQRILNIMRIYVAIFASVILILLGFSFFRNKYEKK